jgi:hypothetical protein
MDDANPLSTPLSPGSELSDIVPSLEEQAEMKSVSYLNAVGALQYLATMTRPDIAYAVSYLGRFNFLFFYFSMAAYIRWTFTWLRSTLKHLVS